MMDEGLLDKFAFTGSTAVGRAIGEVAGGNLINPTLELGGNNPLVAMRDADLDNAVAYGLSSAIYTNQREWARTFKENIQAGMTSINNATTGAEAHIPLAASKARATAPARAVSG